MGHGGNGDSLPDRPVGRQQTLMDGYIWIGDLSDRHQRALRLFVDKYRKGAAEHGDLEHNREWTRDMLGEAMDLTFYMIFELLEHTNGDGPAGGA